MDIYGWGVSAAFASGVAIVFWRWAGTALPPAGDIKHTYVGGPPFDTVSARAFGIEALAVAAMILLVHDRETFLDRLDELVS